MQNDRGIKKIPRRVTGGTMQYSIYGACSFAEHLLIQHPPRPHSVSEPLCPNVLEALQECQSRLPGSCLHSRGRCDWSRPWSVCTIWLLWKLHSTQWSSHWSTDRLCLVWLACHAVFRDIPRQSLLLSDYGEFAVMPLWMDEWGRDTCRGVKSVEEDTWQEWRSPSPWCSLSLFTV